MVHVLNLCVNVCKVWFNLCDLLVSYWVVVMTGTGKLLLYFISYPICSWSMLQGSIQSYTITSTHDENDFDIFMIPSPCYMQKWYDDHGVAGFLFDSFSFLSFSFFLFFYLISSLCRIFRNTFQKVNIPTL